MTGIRICTIAFIAMINVGSVIGSYAQLKPLRKVENNAFGKGEVLNFRVHYGFVNAGTAQVEVKKEDKKIGPRDVYHVVGTGTTNTAFDAFFKVRDHFDSYIDQQALVPWLYMNSQEEGKYKGHKNIVFNHYKDYAKNQDKEIPTPDNVQDLVSTYFYARCLDYSKAKVGDVFTLSTLIDDEVSTFSYKYLGKETITTDLGTIRCLKFCPTLLKGRVFKHEDDMICWISDDENKLPIRAEAQVLVGSVKMDLKSYSGVANPIAFVKR